MIVVSLLGVLFGALFGLLFVRLKNPKSVAAGACLDGSPASAAAPQQRAVPNRRARAAAMLSEMRSAEAALASTDSVEDAGAVNGAVEDHESGESDWEDEDEEESEEDTETDEEYERMEALRLKLVLVVLHGDVKLPPQDVAVLVSSAAVLQIERILGNETQTTGSASTAALQLAPSEATAETRSRWKEWYAGWNLVGCGKITLKTPQESFLMDVFSTAQASGLPCCMLRHSYLETVRVPSEPTPSIALAKEGGSQKKKKKSAAAAAATTNDVPDGPAMNQNPFVVVALGPAPADVLDPFTGSLKLFS